MKRLRVLISAHEFSPEQGSECAVGWNIVTRLAAYHDVTVLCADGPALWKNSYRNAVDRYFTRHGKIDGLTVVYVEQPPAALRYARINRQLMKRTGGLLWQPLHYIGLDHWHKAAYGKALELGPDNFDVVHQLTPISFLTPGYLWKLNKPFLWGPIGGMFKVPSSFSMAGGMKPYLLEKIRSYNIGRQVRKGGFKRIVKKAKRIWAITEDEYRTVATIGGEKVSAMIDTAPPREIIGRVRHYDGSKPLRICWSGSHKHRKALPLLLHAIAALPERNKVFLDIIGDGPETNNWKDLSNKLGLNNARWHGRLPYSQALAAMDKAQLFIHTSYREAASMVILEALGWGMPVICHDACGMGVAVNSTCGIKVPFENPQRSIKGFQQAIEHFLANPKDVERLSQGALTRAAELSWDAKVQEMAEAYTL